MALTQVTGPYPIFTDLDGSPLDDGYLYIGAINEDPETNPIQVFWDSDLTIPATQPIRTNSGYAWRNGTPALLYTAGEFSITIRNKRQEFVLYSPVGYGFDPAAVSASVVKNDFTGDGVEVDFTLSSAPSTILATNVFINGVYQEKDSYSLSGNVITFSIAPPISSSIEVMTNETGVINSGNATAISYTASFPGAVQQTVQTKLEQYVSVKDFGAVGDGVTDDTAAINAAISYAATAINGATGMSVYFPTGTYLISSKITLPNRVGLQGANGRGSIIKPHSTFADSYMFHAVNGTSAMFGSWLRDMWIDARGKNMTAVVWSQAWQETCGMDRVLIQFDGTTQTGFLYTDGYGGAALLKLQDVEIFSNSSYSTVRGIRVNSVSLVGGFVLMVDNSTLAGDAVNKMDIGIDMVNDSLIATGVHGENIDGSILLMQGAGCLSADTITGSSTAVNDLVALGSGFTGKMHLRNMIPNGATGLTVNDDVTGRDIPASAGVIPEYVYQPSAFMATLSGNINNVTGNGTSYTVVFDNEIYDYLGEYDVATGQFVADRAGKYLFSCCLKLNVPVNSTTAVVRLNTSNRTYELYRGSFANQRDSSENVTVNGAMVVDLDDGDGASIEVVVQGIGADTVDVLASDGAVFSGEWLSR